MQHVSKISCNNNSGFIMKFRVQWENGKESSKWSSKYPAGQAKTMDLRKMSIPKGTEIWPEVDAVMGRRKDAWERVVYDPDTENVATYRVYGASFYIHVDLLD
jgi:hypothetical protein